MDFQVSPICAVTVGERDQGFCGSSTKASVINSDEDGRGSSFMDTKTYIYLGQYLLIPRTMRMLRASMIVVVTSTKINAEMVVFIVADFKLL